MFAYAVLVCQVAVAGVFLLSLLSKVRGRGAYRGFETSLAAMGVLPRGGTRPAAFVTVIAEGAAVVLVVLPWHTAAVGFAFGFGLLTVFTAAIVVAMRRGNRASCRCFGASVMPLGLPHVIRNLALLSLCGLGLAGTASGAITYGHFVVGGVTLSAAVALILVLFVQRMDDLLVLFTPESGRGTSG